MKKLILAAVLATLAGSTAFAQSYNPGYGSANIAPVYHGGSLGHGANDSGRGAYALATGPVTARSPRAIIGFDGAVENDPDPNIRFQLRREAQEGW
ncbi:MAG TPA: hypothetical protein VGF53_07915 [Pseudolabrys sp.]|jgi:opacity protein-like surface antigen